MYRMASPTYRWSKTSHLIQNVLKTESQKLGCPDGSDSRYAEAIPAGKADEAGEGRSGYVSW